MYNVTVPTAEHTAGTSSLQRPGDGPPGRGQPRDLGRRGRQPVLLHGVPRGPRQTSQALLVVAEVARTRYYEPPNMAGRSPPRDPVVTSNLDRLRFESFSAAGVYARLDLEPGVLDGRPRSEGTTNVDFNPPMRAALARVHDDEAMLMHVGHDEVRVETLAGSAVERKVPLPERWLKGFAEVQVASARMVLRHDLPRSSPALPAEPAADEVARGRMGDAAGRGLRLASRPTDAAACLAGPERLRLLEKLLPFARSLRIYGPLPRAGEVEPSAWGSSWTARRSCSRSPRAFEASRARVACWPTSPPPTTRSSSRSPIRSTASRRSAQARCRAPPASSDPTSRRRSVRSEPRARRVRPRAERVLPPGLGRHDRATLEGMHPRLLGARELVETGLCACRRTEAASSRAVTRSTSFGSRTASCAARAWYAKHRGERGPCKPCSRCSTRAARRASDERLRPPAGGPRPGRCATR